MAVQPHRNTWTDERLDDLSQSIRDGFGRNDAEHRAMREEMHEGFARVDGRIDGLDRRFDALDHRFDALQRTLILALAGLAAAIIAAAATAASILG